MSIRSIAHPAGRNDDATTKAAQQEGKKEKSLGPWERNTHIQLEDQSETRLSFWHKAGAHRRSLEEDQGIEPETRHDVATGIWDKRQ